MFSKPKTIISLFFLNEKKLRYIAYPPKIETVSYGDEYQDYINKKTQKPKKEITYKEKVAPKIYQVRASIKSLFSKCLPLVIVGLIVQFVLKLFSQ